MFLVKISIQGSREIVKRIDDDELDDDEDFFETLSKVRCICNVLVRVTGHFIALKAILQHQKMYYLLMIM